MGALSVEPLPRETGSSLLDEIRADYEEARKTPKRMDLQVPRSKLGVRYKPIDDDEMPAVDEDIAAEDRNIDILIAACDCIVVRDEHGKWQPFEPYGEPVRFSAELAELMGWHTTSVREVVLEVFSKVPKPMHGVNRHVIAVTKWMMGEERAAEEALLGES